MPFSDALVFSLLCFLQTYSTGRTNVALSTTALGIWILNATLYAIVVSLVFYLAVAPTFEEQGLYVAGTTVFVGLCMSLQAKVAFFHHQWSWPHFLVMFISVGGMFLYFLMIAVSFDDYYYVAHHVYASGIFWLFGFFLMPIITIFIDWTGYYTKLLFLPTNEMLYREFMLAEKFNNLHMLTCLDTRANRRPLSSEKHNPVTATNAHAHHVNASDDNDGIDAHYPDRSAAVSNRIQPFSVHLPHGSSSPKSNKKATSVDL